MCLAVPGRIVEILLGDPPMAVVDIDGITKEVCLAFLPDLAIGDYALIHVGFAISQVDEAAALETLAVLREVL